MCLGKRAGQGSVSRRLITMKCVHEVYGRIHKQYHAHRNGHVRLGAARERNKGREREGEEKQGGKGGSEGVGVESWQRWWVLPQTHRALPGSFCWQPVEYWNILPP